MLKHNTIHHFEIPEDGYVIEPGVLYLGSTVEYTETHAHVPFRRKIEYGQAGHRYPCKPPVKEMWVLQPLDIGNILHSTRANLCRNARGATHLFCSRWRNRKMHTTKNIG